MDTVLDKEIEEYSDEIDSKIGQKVKINTIDKESMEPEDYYYLKEFENKIGIITEQNKCKSGIYNYRVEFGRDKYGYFYERDFILANSK